MALTPVATLYKENYRDIPAMLRRLADDIEEAQLTAKVVVVLDQKDHTQQVRSFGDTDINSAITTLLRGLLFLLRL